MRMYFPPVDKPKLAAKLLARSKADVPLNRALEAIAKATGYRDWHELGCTAFPPDRRDAPPSLEQTREIILAIAASLEMGIGDVHYAVSRSMLLGGAPRSIDDMLNLHAMLWRATLFGTPARGKPGTIVRVKSPGERGLAYLKAAGQPTYVVLDNGVGIRADFEVITPRIALPDFVPSRLWLPYGYWTLKDGSVVIFSRDYKPLWHKYPDRTVRMDPWTWVTGIVDQTYFPVGELAWDKKPARGRAIEFLEKNRLFDPPKLLDAMPHLFKRGIDSVSEAVDSLEDTEIGANDNKHIGVDAEGLGAGGSPTHPAHKHPAGTPPLAP